MQIGIKTAYDGAVLKAEKEVGCIFITKEESTDKKQNQKQHRHQ